MKLPETERGKRNAESVPYTHCWVNNVQVALKEQSHSNGIAVESAEIFADSV